MSTYAVPGAMRAGFELYRAFEGDADDNREALRRNGKLTIPALALWGAISNSGSLLEVMMRELAENVRGAQIPQSAHWIAEENPAALVAHLIRFLRGSEH